MATDIPMSTLEHVTYKGTELNALSVDGCEWRKPYTVIFPTMPTGVAGATVTRSAIESNCWQLSTTLTATGSVLYGDTLTCSGTAATGYNSPIVSFKSTGTNGTTTVNVIFPEVDKTVTSGSSTDVTDVTDPTYLYSANETKDYEGYSAYGFCVINDIEIGTSWTTVYSIDKTTTNGLGYSTEYDACFINGKLTTRTTRNYKTKITVSSINLQASSKNYIAHFRQVNQCKVAGDVTLNVVAGSLKKYTITITNPSYGTVKNGSTTLSSGATVSHGTTLTLTPTVATGYKTIVSATTGNVVGATEATNITVTSDVGITFTRTANTYYVYYKQGTASSTTNLPSTQSRTYPNAVTLATNSMTKNSTSEGYYTVTYNYNGSGASNTTATAAIIRYYTASGWTTSINGSQKYANGASYGANWAGDLTLYPYFSSSVRISSVTLPTPTRSGYAFMGWATSSTATSGTAGGSSYTPNGNVTLYAIWSSSLLAPVLTVFHYTNTDRVSINIHNPNTVTVDYDVSLQSEYAGIYSAYFSRSGNLDAGKTTAISATYSSSLAAASCTFTYDSKSSYKQILYADFTLREEEEESSTTTN